MIIEGKRIPVTYDVHKTYYQECEHERYLNNKAAKHEHSLEQFIETDVSIKLICPHSSTPVENEVLTSEQLSHLPCCLNKRSAKEHQIIYCIFSKRKEKNG